ncbi:hypothetical protein [Fimbriimonas ginsengisoli]|uniref:Uncharacterized protein n=1 Tax=Fimbriimonas ginsengisoli Gsoil 348 TaxID=661478 RepID=A0A068NX75_FIMGI|nr:hypothetical protein [Fimbriimonas ginsengisoli]AIE86229.1 hypothetical protein OP10G_2861 [Fimbriimonas ginsengisoli Gsoil 348]
MADMAEVWKQALPVILNQVSGRGVWAALNAARPVAFEDGMLVLGLASQDSELAGHLRIPATNRLMENVISRGIGSPTRVRIIDGTTPADYEVVKRRDAERRRLQEAEMVKMRRELEAGSSWDSVYDQLSRRFAAVTNKSLPQNRARFFVEAIELIADTRKGMTNFDDMAERTFARCLERVAQYCEIPSPIVAMYVLQRAGEL